MQWNLGDVKVTLVREVMIGITLGEFFPDCDPAIVQANADWLAPSFLNDDGTLPISIHALVVESKGTVIVVDTCIGSRPIPGFDSLSNLQTSFLDDMRAAG